MVSISFSIDTESKHAMDKFSLINWSAAGRELLLKQLKKKEALRKLDELCKNSTLTDEDCIELGRLVNKGMYKRIMEEELAK